MYPADWPKCACGKPVLDGHLTCGEAQCDEALARKSFEEGQEAARTGRMPERYVNEIDAMAKAAIAWSQTHPGAPMAFKFPPPEILVAAGLTAEVVAAVGCTEESRDLLVTMDKAIHGRGTLFMAQLALGVAFGAPKDAADA
jgi:hypothetical protein